jgi:hypothetical protein
MLARIRDRLRVSASSSFKTRPAAAPQDEGSKPARSERSEIRAQGVEWMSEASSVFATGRPAMKTYRILVFDYGHINASHTIEAADDEAATAAARKHLIGSDLEVWERERFVARLKPPN